MDGPIEEIELTADLDPASLVAALRRRGAGRYVALRATGVALGAETLECLVAACRAPLAATASPMPVASAPTGTVSGIPLADGLPPAPTLALPCPMLFVVARDAVDSITVAEVAGAADLAAALVRLGQMLVRAGWRHVAAPGTALAWTAPAPVADRGWTQGLVAAVDGPANQGLATHVGWAATRLRPLSVVIDGACVTGSIHNGSQVVVVNIVRGLKRARPDASVALAVGSGTLTAATELLRGSGVEVIERSPGAFDHDAVYRPYQLLDPGELEWLMIAGRRLLVAQLDTIAFSNPTYHPSPALFHAVRNLQRHTMRVADGVAFISDFGRQIALAECPDLETSRCFVVSCGSDVSPSGDGRPPDLDPQLDRFVACFSATFWHKNRTHAIEVFAQLCRDHGYTGSLVVAGPEPYYGTSAESERAVLDRLPDEVRRRVVHLGRVDEATKWWLMRAAELVLYPSVVEGFGLVPFEAAAAGTPSLSFDGTALHEVLGSGPALVPSWDPHRWADAAAAIVGSSERADAAVDHVRAAGERHTWDRAARLTWDAFDALLARPRAALFVEEGGPRSRVAGPVHAIASGATATHLANRVVSYARRRWSAVRAGSAR